MRGILRWHWRQLVGAPRRVASGVPSAVPNVRPIGEWRCHRPLLRCAGPDVAFRGPSSSAGRVRRIDRSLGTGGAKDRERGPTRIRSGSDLQTPRRRVSVAGGSSCIAIRCPTIRARRITASIARSCSHGARRFVDLADQQSDRSAVVRRRRMRQLRVGGRGTYCSMTTPASRSPLAFRCAATWVGPTAPGAHRSSSPSCFGALPSRNSMRPSASGRTVNALSDAPS